MANFRNLDPQFVNKRAILPYGLTVTEVERSISETYRLYDGLNAFLTSNGFRPLDELLLGNTLSGIVSEFLVKNIARESLTLEANLKVGGYPDLLAKGHYSSNMILKGEEGIEVKCSKQDGGWQGHNPEECWIMIFRYTIGEESHDKKIPLTFIEILCAKLLKTDWSFSGRNGTSRRTPTASITRSGVEKLRLNFIYRVPSVGVGRHRNILAER
jgi:hypothetical protein